MSVPSDDADGTKNISKEMEVLKVEGGERRRRDTMRRTGVSAEPVDIEKLAHEETRIIAKTDEERKQIAEAVKSNFLFTSLDQAQMDTVVNAMESKCYKSDDFIIKQGDDGNEFFVLDQGICECYVDFKNGNAPKMVKKYEPGESFGELALMYNCPRAASIQAKTDVLLWAVDRTTFRKVLLSTTAKKRDQYEDFLENVPLFASLDKYERSKIADVLLERSYQADDYIIKAGDTFDTSFYILAAGTAVATKVLTPGSEPVEVFRYSAGGFFGELALLQQTARAANVLALDDCKCVCIDKASFNRLLGPCEDILKRNQSHYEEVEKRLIFSSRQVEK